VVQCGFLYKIIQFETVFVLPLVCVSVYDNNIPPASSTGLPQFAYLIVAYLPNTVGIVKERQISVRSIVFIISH
jgi:hypothetical protein